jgi:glycosyltransferase involved in cell wall biosynthesis
VKVLAVSSYGVLGGGELSMAEFLAHRPTDVEALGLLVEDGPLRDRLSDLGVETWSARGYDGRPSPTHVARFTRSLLRLLSDAAPDVVWATGLKAAFLSAPACRIAHIPIVWHKIDFSLDSVLARPLAAAVDGVISVSEAAAQALGPLLRRRKLLAVVGPPVRLAPGLHLAPNESTPTIGTVATLTPIKGQRHIIEAAARLSSEFADLRVVLAGSPSIDHPAYAPELHRLAEQLGVAERVHFAGFVSDVTQVLAEMTVFVNATCRDELGFGWEGLSGAMLEASWAGLPVVATRGGGTPEGLLDGVTGTLAAPEDPADLARAIAPYLREPALARAAGEAGRAFTRERFAPAVGAERLFRALAEISRS